MALDFSRMYFEAGRRACRWRLYFRKWRMVKTGRNFMALRSIPRRPCQRAVFFQFTWMGGRSRRAVSQLWRFALLGSSTETHFALDQRMSRYRGKSANMG